ncbi:MAG: 30S ribosomal protein S1 [Candidatus Omnitrophica bacterium]|nr:30S ribosomal protein S1 [Candidatus Omnitrophota bacterium]
MSLETEKLSSWDEAQEDAPRTSEVDYEQTFHRLGEGHVVKGRIIRIAPKEVIVDIGFKSEGMIPSHEFDALESLKVGDEIEVLLEETEDDHGRIVLSKRKAEKSQGWDRVVEKVGEGDTVEGKVTRKVKGGLMMDIGVEAFLPASLAFLKGFGSLNSLLGQTIQVKIVKINPSRKNIIVSRKDLLEKEKQESKAKVLEELEIGSIRKGTVKNITDFGAFVNLGGIDGLLHITDMSWGRINHPSELVKVGDKIEVKILSFDKESLKVSLGLKQKEANPWAEVDKKYPIGSKSKGKVVNVVPYGVFVELERGIEGLVHISEISWTKRVVNPAEVFKIGDLVDVMVLNIDKDHEKISLGIKQTESNPWTGIEGRYSPGMRVKGIVRNLTEFGAFVELAEGIDGLIHVSDMSWTRKVNHPKDILKKGEAVEAVVLMVDQANHKLSLGLKQLMMDPWEEIASKLSVGALVSGTVTKVASFGAFVEIEKDVEGLLHISETELQSAPLLESAYPVGKKIQARIVKIDLPARKIALSTKGVPQE